jgi:MFS transporter, DHA3 family, tetracycline resistance protein
VAVTLAIGLFLALVMPERNFAPVRDHTTWRSMSRQVVAGGRAVRRSAMLTGVVAGTVFAGMSSEGFDRLSQPHFLSDLQFPGTATAELWFGALAVVAALGSIVVTGLLGRRLDAREPRRVGLLLVAVQAAMAAGLIWFGLTGDFWTAVILYLLVTLLRNTAGPILSVWLISGTTPESRATVFSIQAQADALGQIAGGPPSGLVAQHRSIGVPAVALFAYAARASEPVALFAYAARASEPVARVRSSDL